MLINARIEKHRTIAVQRVQAVQRLGQVGAPLEMREFSDGVLVVQALQHSDAQVDHSCNLGHTLIDSSLLRPLHAFHVNA